MQRSNSTTVTQIVGLAFLLSLVLVPTAQAQVSGTGFSINRFQPTDPGSDWFSFDSVNQDGHMRPGVGLTLDYASDPLVLLSSDDEELTRIVGDQLFLHLGGSLVLWDKLTLGLNVPFAVINTGNPADLGGVTYQLDEGAGLGDLRIGGAYRFYRLGGDILRLSAGLRLHLPTGSRKSFTGDGAVRLVPHIDAAGDSGLWAYSARLGAQVRTVGGNFAGEPLGSEMQLGGAVGRRFLDRKLLVGPEIYGAVTLAGAGEGLGERNALELLLGAHYDITPDWKAGLALGPGLANGFGSPDLRVLASIAWMPPAGPKRDADGDGIADSVDACPDVAGAPSDDADAHGCPDTDGDGIYDSEDACPEEAGSPSPDPDMNGCPGADPDGDGILGDADACPAAKGRASKDPGKNGCPRAKLEGDRIVILDQVQFETNSSALRAESNEVLEEVFTILSEHSRIKLVSVEGHTDSTGQRQHNLTLSRRRAASVVSWLVAKGISRQRLKSSGFGPDRPLGPNSSEAGRKRNRRVEFHIKQGGK